MKELIWLYSFFLFVFNYLLILYKPTGITRYPPDPCEAVKTAANDAIKFSITNYYLKAKASIQLAAADGKEHVISFGKDSAGNIITSNISTGNYYSGTLGKVSNRFADLHNHQDNSPPFSGDLYGFIGLALSSTLYQSRYVVTRDGTVYALIIIDSKAARNFITNYPKTANPGYQPRFPDQLVDEFRVIRYGQKATEEMAVAFILEKYNTGVALLKQDSSGNFKRLNTREITDGNGNKIYLPNNCP